MKVAVLSGYGLNCEEETLIAFLEAGQYFSVNITGDIIHINELISNVKLLKQYNILAIPGGFSYGDDTGAGNAFALRILNNLQEEIQEFLIGDKLVIGICNGCQILMKLIDTFSNVTITYNDTYKYQCRWVNVKVYNESIWLSDIETLYIPIAHGEGKFYAADDVLQNLIYNKNVALRYIKDDKNYANNIFPYNPNGSLYDIAAVSDNSGRVLLMMPHPERALFFTQRYDWTYIKERDLRLGKALPIYGDGFKIFCNAIKYFM
ncbi:phosphoribosylformylglycinamidine synthase subunit PurQ [Neoehrlichia mikurensis]|uniref:Phosphoribosylformylglycinamidine synthase subunit PurQ n=1 Tax=Neoehrlichia mikurensis TaxID=89586 RepID=A0A9Q9BVG6_9RICK|nr:phosphoribosylformylglycinamidine synthase subunit PurQ [Neoehrlichia mikurensis]QXK91757.1 phosphoribosylformylglycinamidine synthase subunit PurQ [Neoehrlichia mikurensis]QXK92969.1 phosphoribosylformylglycinamidine synthase subunit PurQ [Neoehrlichia mikurensis]QXK93447.1 phosphoribosylformylglycinamidine synthase subunit PurQ [Neoehrlichia mikurensis]UTO55598.1 phosphoribosylformylglycinamidine synthase subunit PurQ [Neoehrlichia mikurensis]UTO56519.1 phosphoribosylformylglycinamidine s